MKKETYNKLQKILGANITQSQADEIREAVWWEFKEAESSYYKRWICIHCSYTNFSDCENPYCSKCSKPSELNSTANKLQSFNAFGETASVVPLGAKSFDEVWLQVLPETNREEQFHSNWVQTIRFPEDGWLTAYIRKDAVEAIKAGHIRAVPAEPEKQPEEAAAKVEYVEVIPVNLRMALNNLKDRLDESIPNNFNYFTFIREYINPLIKCYIEELQKPLNIRKTEAELVQVLDLAENQGYKERYEKLMYSLKEQVQLKEGCLWPIDLDTRTVEELFGVLFPDEDVAVSQTAMDMLSDIFDRQSKLMTKYGLHPEQLIYLPNGSIDDIALKVVYALIREVVEIGDELPWRWWHDKEAVSHPKLFKEVVDAMHLLVEIGIMYGMTPEVFYNNYCDKNSENFDRIHKRIQEKISKGKQ